MSDSRTSEFEQADDALPDGGHDELREEILSRRIRFLRPAVAICVEPSSSVHDAIVVMKERRIGAVLVTEGADLKGIFTERDVLTKFVGRSKDFKSVEIREVMTADPEALYARHAIAFALNKMVIGGYRHIPVRDCNSGRWHIVSVRDIVGWIIGLFPEQVLNLPPDSKVRNPNLATGG